MKELNIKKIDDVDNKKISEFNKSVAEKINSDNDEILGNDYEKLDESAKLEVIKSIYHNAENVENTNEVSTTLIVGTICAIAIIVICILILTKRKGGKKYEKDNIDNNSNFDNI